MTTETLEVVKKPLGRTRRCTIVEGTAKFSLGTRGMSMLRIVRCGVWLL